ncbi:MAG: hypothetical protein IJ279_00935 [Clostridia bacterium]|nr:hypothetical protein [Clostridia bacterium]
MSYRFRENTDEKIYDCRENCLMYLYRNVNINDYKAYIEKLTRCGYVVLSENIYADNYYTALKGEKEVSAYFTSCDNTLRVAVADDARFPDFDKKETEKTTEPCFYMFENDHTYIDCGMCLITQCSDGSFFVVDSGHYLQFNDNDRIYNFMRERTPAGQKVIVSGWLVTHAHSDHISKLFDFIRYNRHDVEIEAIYSNLISNEYASEEWGVEEKGLAEKFFSLLERTTDIRKVKLHSGQRFYVRDLRFDVLCTHEDVYPQLVKEYNDSSLVVMMTVNDCRVFIPGDASGLESKILVERFGENLECDVVQVSHHGHRGLLSDCYELLKGKLALFPITQIKFDEAMPKVPANQVAIDLADEYYVSSNGTIVVPLPYKKGTVTTLPDETFEDFGKIKRMWGYDYTDEYKKEMYELYLKNGGKEESLYLPVRYSGTFEM